MISENERRDWIEVGVHATLASVYWLVATILVVNLIVNLVLLFFATPAAITAFLAGISVSLLIFTIVSICTVKADKISREWA